MPQTSSSSSPSSTRDTSFHRYELPAELLAPVMAIINAPRGWHRRNLYRPGRSEQDNAAINHLVELQHRLIDDAIAYYSRHSQSTFSRPTPNIAPHTHPAGIIAPILNMMPGLLLGNSDDETVGNQFLLDNMQTFRAEKITTLYMDRLLSDAHAGDLKQFNASGTITAALADAAERMDHGHPGGVRRTSLDVMKAAHQAGIRIMALDCLASVHLRGLPDPHDNLRQLVMNYYALQVINETADGKWIALIEHTHVNRFNLIPGLAELTGGTGIRFEADASLNGRVQADEGEFRLAPHPGREYWIKTDLVVTDRPSTTTAHAELDARIKRPGQFMVNWRAEHNRFELRYRTPAGQVAATPILHDRHNIYVENDAPQWLPINTRRYASLTALCRDLDIRLGMERVLNSQPPPTETETGPALLDQALRSVWAAYFKRKKNGLLLYLSVFASSEERHAFASGKQTGSRELANLGLSDADLSLLIRYFSEPPGPLTLSLQGALLQRIHELQGQQLTQQAERWSGQIETRGGIWIKSLAHNLYLAASERSIGVCGAITAQVAASWLLDANARGAPGHHDHLGRYLAAFNASIHSPQADASRIFGLGLLEWSFHDPAAKFGSNHVQSDLSANDLIGILQRIEPPAVWQLGFGQHAMMLGVRSLNGIRSYIFADPNYGVARFDSIQALHQALTFQSSLLQTLERQSPAAPQRGRARFSLRQYREDLAQQTLFSTRYKGRPELRLRDLCATEALPTLFGLAPGHTLEDDAYFLKLKKRLSIAEYRTLLLDENHAQAGTALNPVLEQILRKHATGISLHSRLLRILFNGKHATVILTRSAMPHSLTTLTINGDHYPQDIQFLRRYQTFIDKLTGRPSASLLQVFLPRPHLSFDTLYLASALPEDGFILPEHIEILQRSAQQTCAEAAPVLPSTGDEARLALSQEQLRGEQMAQTFDLAAGALLAGEAQPGRWIPLLHTLKSRPDGTFGIEFADREKPGKSTRHITSDPRWQEVRDFLRDKTATLSRTAPQISNAEAIDGLNSAFAIQAMLRWLYQRDSEQAARPGIRSSLAQAVLIQNRIGLGQIAVGILKDGDNLRKLLSNSLRTEASIGARLLSTAGSGLQIFGTLLDIYELSQAELEEQKAVFGTHLSFDSAGLGLGSMELFGLEVEVFGETVALTEVTGPLGVVLAGIALGASALAQNFAALTRNVLSVGQYFQKFHDNYRAGGYRYDASAQLLEALPLVVVSCLDLRNLRVEFDSPHLYASHVHRIFNTPDIDRDRNHAFDIRARMHLPASAPLPPESQDVPHIMLPAAPKAFIGYGYSLMAGCTTRHDAGFDLLRGMAGNDFTFDCYRIFEYAIGQLDFEYQETTVRVRLDAKNRTLLMPDPVHDTVNRMHYELTGNRACYTLGLKPHATLTLTTDAEAPAQTEWKLDVRALSGSLSIRRSGQELGLTWGSCTIRFPDIARVGRVRIMSQNQVQHELVLADGHLEPAQLDVSNWIDQGGQLRAFLARHKMTEHFVQLDGYRINNQREIARAYYDVQQNKYLYIDDKPGYPDARLVGQAGNDLYYYADDRRKKILRVDTESHRVTWIYAAQQGGHHPLRLQSGPAGLFIEQDNASGGQPIYRLVHDTLLLVAIRNCPALIDQLATRRNAGKLSQFLPPLLTLADCTRGQSYGNQIQACGFAPWIALDAPGTDARHKRVIWLREQDGLVVKPELPPMPDTVEPHPGPIPADLALAGCDRLASGVDVFFFYSASMQWIFRQEDRHPARLLTLPASLTRLNMAEGKRYATLGDGRVGQIDRNGKFILSAVNRHFLGHRPEWWHDLKTLAPNGTLAVLDIKSGNGRHPLPIWLHDDKLVIANPALPTSVQLFRLSPDQQQAWLYDPATETSYLQPLLDEHGLQRAFGRGIDLLANAFIPQATIVFNTTRLSLRGNTLSIQLGENRLPRLKGVTQLLVAIARGFAHLTIEQTHWSHYQSMVVDLGTNIHPLPEIDLEIQNPLALTVSRDAEGVLRLEDRSNGKSLRLSKAFTTQGRLKTPVNIRQPDGTWLHLRQLPQALNGLNEEESLQLLYEPHLPEQTSPNVAD